MPGLLLLLLCLALPLTAQTNSATFRGQVKDPSQAPIPAASVRVTNPDTGQTTNTSTNE